MLAAEPQFAPPLSIVCVPTSATKRHIEAAKKVAAAFAISIRKPLQTDRNPTCCIYLEITHWLPNGAKGYIINHQPGGTVLAASTEDELDQAVEAFVRSAKSVNGIISAPVGIQTSYPVVYTPK